MKIGKLRISFGEREWEVQGFSKGEMLNFTGWPFMTKAEARDAANLWFYAYDFYDEVRAINTKTGEKFYAPR